MKPDAASCFLAILQIKAGGDGNGLTLFDPGYINTAPVKSSISYIDGDKGILRYRGYPIEELAEKSTFLETAYLLRECTAMDQVVVSITHIDHCLDLFLNRCFDARERPISVILV